MDVSSILIDFPEASNPISGVQLWQELEATMVFNFVVEREFGTRKQAYCNVGFTNCCVSAVFRPRP